MREKLLTLLAGIIGAGETIDLTVPDEPKFGHYSTNMAMRLGAKSAAENGKLLRGETSQGGAPRKKPMELAEELAAKIAVSAPAGFFEKVEAAAPGFINFWLSKEVIQKEFVRIAGEKDFGRSGAVGNGRGGGASDAIGKGAGVRRTVIVEYSQPNIAKALNLGHFRTTIIGDALANIFEALGYEVVRWNYLGDWGTQFGKLVVAYKLWGDKAAVERNPIDELQKLYVHFHEEAKLNPELEKRGQEEFKKLEEGDAENRKLWQWFKEASLKELKKIYAALGVDFDVWIGESFFEGDMKPLAAELAEKGIAERSEGALVIRLDEYNLQPALIEKSDGASLYLARDIANLRYRLAKYKPEKILYVVSNEQSHHFEQLFAVAKKLGMDSAAAGASGSEPTELKHVKYGLVLGEGGKKLSTREGRTVSLDGTIQKAIALARQIVEEKARDLSDAEKDEVAAAVGIGALKYNDLKENRMTDIVFDWEKMLDFTGESAPYLQYTYARLKSILRKAEGEPEIDPARCDSAQLDSETELALMRKIFEYPDIVQKAGELYATSLLAGYLYKLAAAANKFYETTPILRDENAARRDARMALVAVAARTIQSGLALLGVKALEKI